MRRETGNPCFDCRCGWYDSDLGCTCPSLEKMKEEKNRG